jgi:glycosyltransferase involved in cell wall biosynthesis
MECRKEGKGVKKSGNLGGTHLHLYYCAWTNESRAWREGASSLRHGLAKQITYVGYRSGELPEAQTREEGQLIYRIGAAPVAPGSSRWLRAASLPRWWRACLRDIDLANVDLIVAHSLAALPVALALKRRAGVGLVYDAHELETERAGWSWGIRRIARFFEKRLIRRCDHTFVVSDAIKDWYLDAYPGLAITTVRNIADTKMVSEASSLRETLKIAAETLVYTYCGAITRERGLEELVDVFCDIGNEYALVLVGDGPALNELKGRASGAENIYFHPAVPVERLVNLISGADVGVFVTASASLSYRYCLPNKVFEYAAAKLPMLLGDGPELLRFTQEYPAARTAASNRAALHEAITTWARDEIRAARSAIQYTPPTWRDEEHLLIKVFKDVQSKYA